MQRVSLSEIKVKQNQYLIAVHVSSGFYGNNVGTWREDLGVVHSTTQAVQQQKYRKASTGKFSLTGSYVTPSQPKLVSNLPYS